MRHRRPNRPPPPRGKRRRVPAEIQKRIAEHRKRRDGDGPCPKCKRRHGPRIETLPPGVRPGRRWPQRRLLSRQAFGLEAPQYVAEDTDTDTDTDTEE